MHYRVDKTLRVQKRLAVGQRCPYCKRVMAVDDNADLEPTIDHIVTQGRGGSDNPENLVWSCRRCNNLRDEVPHDVFVCFAKHVLMQYPDYSITLLRKSLREFVYWLAQSALGKKLAVNHAVRMSLLRLAADVERSR